MKIPEDKIINQKAVIQPRKAILELRKLRGDRLSEDLKWALDVFKKLDLSISLDGDFVSPETKERVSVTHIRCILRREYIESGRNLRGRALDTFIAMVLMSLIRAVGKIHESGKHADSFIELAYSEKYV